MERIRRRTVMEMRSLAILTMLFAMALPGVFVKMYFTPGAVQANGLMSESRILMFGIIPCADAALLTLTRLLWKYAANIKAQLCESVDDVPSNSSANWGSRAMGDDALVAKTPDFQRN